jgi:hypothetical protein
VPTGFADNIADKKKIHRGSLTPGTIVASRRLRGRGEDDRESNIAYGFPQTIHKRAWRRSRHSWTRQSSGLARSFSCTGYAIGSMR